MDVSRYVKVTKNALQYFIYRNFPLSSNVDLSLYCSPCIFEMAILIRITGGGGCTRVSCSPQHATRTVAASCPRETETTIYSSCHRGQAKPIKMQLYNVVFYMKIANKADVRVSAASLSHKMAGND